MIKEKIIYLMFQIKAIVIVKVKMSLLLSVSTHLLKVPTIAVSSTINI